MKNNLSLSLIRLSLVLFIFISNNVYPQTIVIEDFEGYNNTEAVKNSWQISGDITVDCQLVTDSTEKLFPGGAKYLEYSYISNPSTTGGIIEKKQESSIFPLDVSSANAGFQFYYKGDGTGNQIYFQYYQYNGSELIAIWKSQGIALTKTTWQIARIPFKVDASGTHGFHLTFTNGSVSETDDDLKAGLNLIGKYEVCLENSVTQDGSNYKIYFDDFRAMEFFPPNGTGDIKIADFEGYKSSTDFIVDWQGFGYGTLDYYLERSDSSPEGYKNALWVIEPEDRTTWGMAFRSRSAFYKIPNLSSIAEEGGVQFLLKGDGSDDKFLFRFTDANNNYWGSYWMSLKDTNWHMEKVPFIVDTLKGFRWLGNDPNGTYWTSDIGSIEELRSSLSKITEVRWDKRNPVHDEVRRNISIDALYAVNKFPPLPAVEVDYFDAYTDSDNLKASWNQFGTGSLDLELSTSEVKNGTKAIAVSYNGINGYTAIRKRNIIPGINFSELKAGIQFWLKGDGSNNLITFRLQSGNEMWESVAFSLNETEWKHVGVEFKADSISGFRYLGNNPDVPIWSADIGTDEQLYGDIANIDQVRFYVRNPEAVDASKTFIIDKVEGVDEFDGDIYIPVGVKEENNLPYEFDLKQNYPNPFNPVTNILYSLQESGVVSLKVFNILGQEVTTLINEFQTAGYHHQNFDASKLVSGVYIYQLRTGSFVSAKKMILIK